MAFYRRRSRKVNLSQKGWWWGPWFCEVSQILSFPDFGFPGFWVSCIFGFPDFEFPGFWVSRFLGFQHFGFPGFLAYQIFSFPDFESHFRKILISTIFSFPEFEWSISWTGSLHQLFFKPVITFQSYSEDVHYGLLMIVFWGHYAVWS